MDDVTAKPAIRLQSPPGFEALVEVWREDEPGKHTYCAIEEPGGEIRKGPGITTIQSKCLPKQGLVPWAAKLAFEGVLHDIEAGMSLAEIRKTRKGIHYADKKRDTAADAGTLAHDILERVCRMVRDTPGTSFEHTAELVLTNEDVADSAVEIRVLHGARWLDQHNATIIDTEFPVWEPNFGWGATIDLWAWIDYRGDQTPYILDWKTGAGVYQDVCFQLAFQKRALQWSLRGVGDRPGLGPFAMALIPSTGVLHLTEKACELIETVEPTQDQMIALLAMWHWQNRKDWKVK